MTLIELFFHFLLFSLLSIGGTVSVAPDMHRLLVDKTSMLTDTQFNASIAIAQAAPGPNVLFVTVMGYQAAGLAGVIATLSGIMLPSTTLSLAVSRWGHHRQDWPGVQAFKAGMAPITIGLLFATGWILTTSGSDVLPSPALLTLTVLSALLVWRTRLHLLWLIVLGACTGAAGWV